MISDGEDEATPLKEAVVDSPPPLYEEMQPVSRSESELALGDEISVDESANLVKGSGDSTSMVGVVVLLAQKVC